MQSLRYPPSDPERPQTQFSYDSHVQCKIIQIFNGEPGEVQPPEIKKNNEHYKLEN